MDQRVRNEWTKKFEITTLLVLEDMYQGFTRAFYFSNRNDHVSTEIFLESNRKHIGVINLKTLMTDMANVFRNSWKYVKGDVKKRLFCTQHVQNTQHVSLAEENKSYQE